MKKPVKLPETVGALPLHSTLEAKEESNPFTSKDWRMWAYAWTGMVLRVLLVVGAVFSVVQFLQARQESRVARTLQLVELWERPEYQTAQTAIKRRLAALNEQAAGMVTDKTTEAELNVIAAILGNQAMTAEGGTMPLAEFQEQFDRVVYFLSRVGSCVEGNLCDRKVADEFFLDYARSFWRYFGDYIEAERTRGSPKLAAQIETYLKHGR